MDERSKNIQIAKNTAVLYCRTIIVLVVSLYTSRVVLNTLGVEDYGIYNVVGGFVTMFSLLSSSLSNAISRFITIELGRGNIERLKNIFSTSVNVQIVIAILIGILLEIIGIWFLNHKMIIPENRIFAANIVMHCSIVTFMINLISIPYNSCIIAHEKMTAFAYISILETVLKLCSVLVLYINFFDNLIVYAVLIMLTSVLIRVVYGQYCSKRFQECHYTIKIEKPLLREMFSLASWNLLGSGASVLNNHGINVVVNMFFGVALNAARGIAVQVNGAIIQFVTNFTTALNPQITKSYAVGDYDRMRNLIYKGSRFSFYLLFLIAMPILIETPTILKLWLNVVPEYAVIFVRYTLVISLISVLTTSLFVVVMATGNIKKYQLVIGSIALSTFLLTYLSYRLGANVEITYVISIIIEVAILIARLLIVNQLVDIGIRRYFTSVIFKVLLVVFSSAFFPLIFSYILQESMCNTMIILLVSVLSTSLSVMYVGMEKYERTQLLNMVYSRVSKF